MSPEVLVNQMERIIKNMMLNIFGFTMIFSR